MTTQDIKPLIAGNWKMNGLLASQSELASILEGSRGELEDAVDLCICPPATLISTCVQKSEGYSVYIGGQDCHFNASGAHTGDIAAEMLADLGAKAVIVGHSERRNDHYETNEIVKSKADAALRAGLIAIICIGETKEQREAGEALSIVSSQLTESLPQLAEASNTVIAYEPVWAIGTGLTPTLEDIGEVHNNIRDILSVRLHDDGKTMRLLYGGSVKPANAKDILSVDNVDGALVGGASLKAQDFLAIAKALM
jgi:triosephosphate isomerase